MNLPLPFSLLADSFGKLSESIKVPEWLIREMQHRMVLFLNHVLMQEPEAQTRLAQQKGRVVQLQWRHFKVQLAVTPAGLCELVDVPAPDLRFTVTDDSPVDLVRHAVHGNRPGVRIEGDVQFASEVNWLVDHVRWDTEEDLSRLVGDASAHTLCTLARNAVQALRRFISKLPGQDWSA